MELKKAAQPTTGAGPKPRPNRDGKFSRSKGQREQRQAVNFLRALGINAELLARAGYSGPDIGLTLDANTKRTVEVKCRGFNADGKPNYIPHPISIVESGYADMVYIRRTGGEPYLYASIRDLVALFNKKR